MSDRIDHKDEPGEYRDAVFQHVQKSLGFHGHRPTSPAFLLGDWTYRFGAFDAPPFARQSFTEDGGTRSEAADGSWSNTKDRWVFHDSGSLSLWSFVDPMPEYGIKEPTYSEDRYHVLIRDGDGFVLFNGDGSLVMAYTRA